MQIVLLGYMGSGKSSVGKRLASLLNFPFKDLDAIIAEQEGMTVSNLFASKGEIYFRKLENQLLRDTLNRDSPLILATGGGTPCYGTVMDFLQEKKDVCCIYLKYNPAVLAERLFEIRESRPLISHIEQPDDLLEFVAKHLFERSPFYSRADVTIQADQLSVDEVVEQIILQLF